MMREKDTRASRSVRKNICHWSNIEHVGEVKRWGILGESSAYFG